MNTIEIIIFAILAVIATLTGFDFVVYVAKSAPKKSNYSKRMWRIGFLCAVALVYWFMNGLRFLP